MSDREQRLLRALIESYIREGQPVASKALADRVEFSVSSATVRNVMAALEERGLIMSPHTSAGRVPTPLGYRLFVDDLLQAETMDPSAGNQLSQLLNPDMSNQEMVASTSALLSDFTRLAGLVTLPNRNQAVLKLVEFLPLSANRVLVILVLDDHEVQNRVIHTESEYSRSQLEEAADFVNQSYAGQSLTSIRASLVESMESDRAYMDSLMQTITDLTAKAFSNEAKGDYVLVGQERLLDIAENQALGTLRELFQALTLKADILHLLDKCMESDGVKLFIGEESGYRILDECAIVTAPYSMDGEAVGVLGVIGPTRMAYKRVIPIVHTAACVLGAALDASIR